MVRLESRGPIIMDLNKREVLKAFELGGEVVKIESYGNGHINDTFLVTLQKEDGTEAEGNGELCGVCRACAERCFGQLFGYRYRR